MNGRVLKIVGAVILAVILALASGWVWGTAGRLELQAKLDDTTLQLHMSEARARLLAARVDLYSLNFGAATKNLESAKLPLEGALGVFEQEGDTARANTIRATLASTEEGRSLAAQVNQSAQASVERALSSLAQAAPQQGR